MKFYSKAAVAALALAAAGVATVAEARSNVYFSVGANVAPGVSLGVSNAPVYYGAPVVYAAPAPVYYEPAPIVYSAPVYYRPAPIVYVGPRYYGPRHHGYYRTHGGRHWN
ncbi:hypothetical protein [Caenimonas aquaedulcis]|uniref:Virulence factor n=1 Tax=Caenimonas aquaedulcis TaxID=2793270 RepID=A0A931MG37_9BURK|nr:hypothetical protein [Caenimonas aquaedulcis]MBG9387738.1 hypothetical protein [Caenimonas aquaedulcis]